MDHVHLRRFVMNDITMRLARRFLVERALALLQQALDQIGDMPDTDRLALLAAIANVAYRLSLKEVPQDQGKQGREFSLDQMSIIMQRIPIEEIIQSHLNGDRDQGLIFRYVEKATLEVTSQVRPADKPIS